MTLQSTRSHKIFLALGIVVAVATPSAESAAYPLNFPSRGDVLESGAYFRSRGHTAQYYGNEGWAMDLHAAKWDGGNWQAGDGSQNEDQYIFGAELFAPEDGEIISCWRTAPEKPAPGVNYDLDGDGIFGEANNCVAGGNVCEEHSDCAGADTCGTGHDASPLGAGNHLQIRNSTGDYIVLFAHLQDGSIPAGLCPLPADRDEDDTTSSPGFLLPGPDGWPDDRSEHCGTSGLEGVAQGTLLPTPVPIKAGEFIGRVGHSGRSTGPHLHMHVKPLSIDNEGDYCLGISEEIEFYESWSQMCNVGEPLTGGWSQLDGDNPLQAYPIGGPCEDDSDCVGDEVCSREECVIVTSPFCFLPDPIGIEEDHENYGVPATNLNFTTHTDGDVLVYQSSGALRLRSYDVNANGSIVNQDTHDEGGVLDVAVARPNSTRNVIVSIRGNNGNLKHIPYTVNNVDGAITRVVGKELTESDVDAVESTPSPAHDGFVVAIKDSTGDLEVIDYHVNGALDITRNLSTGSGGAIDDLAITTMNRFDGVVTAEITSAGGLVVRSFEVPAGGGVTTVEDQLTFIAGESVTIDRVPTAGLVVDEYVVTSVIRPDQTLRLDVWSVDFNGLISWVDTTTAGVVSGHDGTAGAPIQGDFVMALRDSADEFRMIGWSVDWLGNIRRNSTHNLGPVTEAAIATTAAGGGNHLVAARTDALGDLHLFSYSENFNGWF